MSKLDVIQTTCDNCEYAPALSDECKQRIKDLMLELIDEAYPEKSITYVEDSRRKVLRQKVNEL